MPDLHDPRIYFAAERTLLAWIRTSLGLMGMGFVVARFGLFLRLMAEQPASARPSGLPTFLGIALVTIGAAAALAAGVQHQRFIRTLSQPELPRAYWPAFALLLAYAIAAAGLVLAVLLVL